MNSPVEGFGTDDLRHMTAAEGWLTLGDYLEANEELEKTSPQLRNHPLILAMRAFVYEAAGKLETSREIAKVITDEFPEWVDGWLHQAKCLHKLGKTVEGYQVLIHGAKHVSDNTLNYNAAVYSAHLGMIGEAKEWLKLAFENDPDGIFRMKALDDPQLERIWRQA